METGIPANKNEAARDRIGAKLMPMDFMVI
jgi:hypothetical protein